MNISLIRNYNTINRHISLISNISNYNIISIYFINDILNFKKNK